MAESDAGRRTNGTVSTEEAERLSERFRPSWEDDPAEPPLSAAITRPLPVVAVTAETKAKVPPAPAPAPEPPQPTLVGISPEPPPHAPGDELDWGEPPNKPSPQAEPGAPLPVAAETPSSAAQTQRLQVVPMPVSAAAAAAADPEISVQIDVEELPPASKPSGIGEKYIPKEEGAPPVVLNEDVEAAEIRARQALEAQHHARRAPTILRMKAAEVPLPAAAAPTAAEEEVPFAPRRSGGAGKLVALSLTVFALAAGAAVFVQTGMKPERGAEPAAPSPVATAPDTAAPPPPPPAVAPAPEPTPSQTAGAATAAEPAPAGAPELARGKEARPAAGKATAASSKPASATKASPVSKTGPAAAKPATKTGSSKPGAKAAIVRDAPF